MEPEVVEIRPWSYPKWASLVLYCITVYGTGTLPKHVYKQQMQYLEDVARYFDIRMV